MRIQWTATVEEANCADQKSAAFQDSKNLGKASPRLRHRDFRTLPVRRKPFEGLQHDTYREDFDG